MSEMMNYLKSEMYRVVRSKGIYLLIGGCAALVLAMNLVLWYFGHYTKNFPYANTGFAFSMLITGMQVPLCLTSCISSFVFADEYKNKTFSNCVSFGYSEKTLFFGKLIVTMIVSLIGLLVVEGIFIGSGYLLLEDSGTQELVRLLRATVACLPLFMAGVSGALALTFIFKNETNAVWCWVGIFVGISFVASLLGMKLEIFQNLEEWLAFNIVGNVQVNEATGDWYMLWDSNKGFLQTTLAGILGTQVFVVAGVLGVRKRK